MMCAVASWWNGTVVATKKTLSLVQASAIAAIGRIHINCASVSRAMLHEIADRWSSTIMTSKVLGAHAQTAIELVAVVCDAMAAAIIFIIARWYSRAVTAGPPIRTVAHASICTVCVQSGMPIAMSVLVARWWNRTVNPMILVGAVAIAAIA